MTPPVTSTTPIQKAPTWPKVTPPNALVRPAVGLDNSMRFLTRAGRSTICVRNTQVGSADSPGFGGSARYCRIAQGVTTARLPLGRLRREGVRHPRALGSDARPRRGAQHERRDVGEPVLAF